MFFFFIFFQPQHPMGRNKVMSLMYCLVCDECIHICFTRMHSNHCLSQNMFGWSKYFVSHIKSHLPLVSPSRQMRTAAVVFIRHGDRQRYRASLFHFIRCMWQYPYLSHQHLAIYMFVVVNFDALAQASDIRIERRQVVFLCWMQDSNPSGYQTPNRQQTECPLTNRRSYRGSSFLFNFPNKWSTACFAGRYRHRNLVVGQ